jgi:hypothetical protein
MSDPEESQNLPAKVGSNAMLGLNLIKDNFTTPATDMDDEHETESESAFNATADDDVADDDPLKEVYNNDLERCTDQAVKSRKEKGKPSKDIPELLFCIPCIHPTHTVTNSLDKGYFSIKGSVLDKLLVNQAVKWADDNLKKTSCGWLGCEVTLSECLHDEVVGDLLCYMCKGIVSVDAQTACTDHPETKLEYLVVVALSQVVSWYTWRARYKVLRNITLPFAELIIHPMSQIFPVSILQGLRLHPGQTELNSLVTILTENDKAGDITGLKDKAKVGSLGASGKRLRENQKLKNWMKDLIHQKKRLMTNNRKCEELSVNFSPFKKCKLHEVGNRQSFETVRVSNFDDEKSGRLKG